MFTWAPPSTGGVSGNGCGKSKGSCALNDANTCRNDHDRENRPAAGAKPERSETQFASAQRVAVVVKGTPVCVATLSVPVSVVCSSLLVIESPNWSTRYRAYSQPAPKSAMTVSL